MIRKFLLAASIALIAAPLCHARQNFMADFASGAASALGWAKKHYGGNVELSHCFYWEDFMRTTSGQASITTTQGFYINDHVYAGVGTGIVFFYGDGWLGGHIPIFADVRYTPLTRRWRPFVDLKAGYAYGSECALVQPAIGIKCAFGRKFGLALSFGTTAYMADYLEHKVWCNGLNATLGIEF